MEKSPSKQSFARTSRNNLKWFYEFVFLVTVFNYSLSFAGPVNELERYPLATASRMSKVPIVDGVIDRKEWYSATQIGPLNTGMDDTMDPSMREVYIGYGQEGGVDKLFVAFQLQRPKDLHYPKSPGGSVTSQRIDEDGWAAGKKDGDAFELHLDVGHTESAYKLFIVYPNGSFLDAKISLSTDSEEIGMLEADVSWNPSWTVKTRLTDTGWEGEMSIPLSELGGTPIDGTIWGFDAVDAWLTPRQSAHWAFRGVSQYLPNDIGHLQFQDSSASIVRFKRGEDAGNIGSQRRFVVSTELVNPNSGTRTLQSNLEVYRRPIDLSQNLKQSGNYFDTNNYERIINLQTNTVIPSLQRRTFGTFQPGLGTEEYAAMTKIVDDSGRVLYGRLTPFRLDPLLDVKTEGYWIFAKKLNVITGVQRLGLVSNQQVNVVVNFLNTNGIAIVPSQTTLFNFNPNNPKVENSISTAKVNGVNTLQVLAYTNSVLAGMIEQVVQRPPTPLWATGQAFATNYLGNLPLRRNPWTPLSSSSNGIVNVWNRKYTLSNVFPSSITVGSQELLGNSMTLYLYNSSGRQIAWNTRSVSRRPVVIDATMIDNDATVTYDVVLKNAIAQVTGTMKVEFDGMIWYDLELKAASGTVSIGKLDFQMDLLMRHAKLMTVSGFINDPIFKKLNPKSTVPLSGGKDGVITDSQMPFTPCLWLGNEKAGLTWFAEGPIDWNISAQGVQKVIEIDNNAGPVGNRVIVKMHMADQATTLYSDKPMRLKFGLQATPIRAKEQTSDLLTHVTQVSAVDVDYKKTDHSLFGPWKDFCEKSANNGVKTIILHSQWKGPGVWAGWAGHIDGNYIRGILKQGVDIAHSYGLKVVVYTGWGVNTTSSEWAYYGNEMVAKPLEDYGSNTYRQSCGLKGGYGPFMAYQFGQDYSTFGFDGVLWDSTSNLLPDQNLDIGNGWIDNQGNVRPTYPILATRDMFRRVFNIFHGEVFNNGCIINHPGSFWPINGFTDIHHRGEFHETVLLKGWSSPESFRSAYEATPFGLPFLGMNKNYRADMLPVNKIHSMSLVHSLAVSKSRGTEFVSGFQDYSVYGRPIAKIWKARLWLPFNNTTTWFPYHEYDGVQKPKVMELQTAATVTHLHGSAFVSRNKRNAILVISLWDRLSPPNVILNEASIAVQVKLNLAALGLPTTGTYYLKDAINNEVFNMTIGADGKGTFDVGQLREERYRLIRLSRDPIL